MVASHDLTRKSTAAGLLSTLPPCTVRRKKPDGGLGEHDRMCPRGARGTEHDLGRANVRLAHASKSAGVVSEDGSSMDGGVARLHAGAHRGGIRRVADDVLDVRDPE